MTLKSIQFPNPVEGMAARSVAELPVSGSRPGELLVYQGRLRAWYAPTGTWEHLGFIDTEGNAIYDFIIDADADVLATSRSYTDSTVAAAIASAVTLQGNFDASGGTYPATGGSRPNGAIKKGDAWYITGCESPTTIGDKTVTNGDFLYSKADDPGQTDSNWAVIETFFSYVAENTAEKATSGTVDSSTIKYPSNLVVKNTVEALRDTNKGSILYVRTSGNDTTGVGSLLNPYATWQKGIDTAGSAGVVNVVGSFSENVTIATTQSRIVEGQGSDNSTILTGDITFGQTGSIYTIFKNIDVRGTIKTTGLGGWRFKDAKASNSGGNIIDISGALTGNIVFDRFSSTTGNIVIGTTNTQDIQLLNSWFGGNITINGGVVLLRNIQGIGTITLNAGVLILDNISAITKDGSGVSIYVNATAASGSALYLMSYVNLLQTDSTFGKIKRGDASKNAPIILGGDLKDSPTDNVLYTTPIVSLNHLAYANVGYPSPTNYTTVGDLAALHFAGIDTKLGVKAPKGKSVSVLETDWTTVDDHFELTIPAATHTVSDVASASFWRTNVGSRELEVLLEPIVLTNGDIVFSGLEKVVGSVKVLGV